MPVVLQNLLYDRQKRLQLRLRAWLTQPVTRRAVMFQDFLQRMPAELVLTASRSLADLSREHTATNLSPPRDTR